jgi:ABC-type iron transport system FetAB permease component
MTVGWPRRGGRDERVQLSPVDLAIASLLILALAGLSWRMQIGVERQLLISALRSTVQLFLIGLVLKVSSTTPTCSGSRCWRR